MSKILKIDNCICGGYGKLASFYIKGSANKKNYFVKCSKCATRTRNRKIPSKAIEEWNEFKGELYLKEKWK